MANRIKGITVEIGGDTTGLDKALKSVNSSITKTQSALNDVNRLLKLDPSNTVLVAQKQELLSQAVGQTEDKLKALESAQEQVAAAFQRGDIGAEKYQAFQREVEETRGKLNQYKNDLASLQTEQDQLSANTARLEKLFSATGTQVDDYADVLGTRLTSAIKNGTANSDQLRTALEKIGKAAAGGKVDIRQLTDALDTVDDGEAIRNLIEQLNQAGEAAQNTAEDVGQIAENTKGAALMQAADQLSAVGDKIQEIGTNALEAYSDTENAVTKVNAYFGETGQAAEQSASVIKAVYSAGVGESMDAVANAVLMVKKNLGDLSETDLTNLTQQAITLEELYGIDMNETLRGVNSLMQQYGLTAQEAMDYIVVGTQNGLDKTNELGDNLSEYAGKFSQAGYSASEYFQLLDNGLKNGAYNLDKVNDAINEVTTRLVDGTIGESIPNAVSGVGTLTCTTYNGNTSVGSKSVNFTLTVPASVKPTLTSITAARIDGDVPSSWGIYVQNKSNVKLTINGAAGAYGSTIKSYSISGGSYAGTGSTLTTGALVNSGSLTFTGKVTDSRGRVSDAKTVTISVVAYSAPAFSSYLSQRCLSNGTLDEDGTYVHALLRYVYSSCSGKNTITTKTEYRKVGDSQWMNAGKTFASLGRDPEAHG